jgi:hypothetical protein
MTQVFPYAQSQSTLTCELGAGLLLRISIDEGNYMVTDLIGLRYGHAPELVDALVAWAEQVDEIVGHDGPLGDPLKSEVAAYRKALNLS